MCLLGTRVLNRIYMVSMLMVYSEKQNIEELNIHKLIREVGKKLQRRCTNLMDFSKKVTFQLGWKNVEGSLYDEKGGELCSSRDQHV